MSSLAAWVGLAVVALLAVQLLSAGVASAESIIAKPDIAASGSFDGDVVFEWENDSAVEYWAVAVVYGSCTGLSAESTVTDAQATCTADAAASGPLCVSVKGHNDTDTTTSPFSNWRCVDADAFGIDPVAGGYVTGDSFAIGRVDNTGAVLDPAGVGADDCVVDLSFVPYRYACVDTEPNLGTTVDRLAEVTEASNRVFWVGATGNAVVEDFDPQKLVADLAFEDTLDAADWTAGQLQTTYTVENQPYAAGGAGIAPAVGVTLPVAAGFDRTTVQVPNDCVLVVTDLRCFGGDLAPGEIYTFVVSGLPNVGATAGQFAVVAVIDTDIPAPGEAVEGEKAGDDAGGAGGGLGGNGRSNKTSAVFDFGAEPGQSSGDGTDGDGPLPGGDGSSTGVPACFECIPSGQAGGPPTAGTGGDPHMVSFDGVRFQFHAAGDYLLSRSLTDGYEVHVRYGRFGPRQISWSWGVAMNVGDSVLTFGDDPTATLWDPRIVQLDGVDIVPTVSGQTLPGGSTLKLVESSQDRYEVRRPDGSRLLVGVRIGDAIRLEAGPGLQGNTEGLGGNADGVRSGDLVASNGASFDFDSLERYTVFGDSWFLDADSTFFTTELPDSALLPIIPVDRFSLSDLAAAALAEAEAICRAEGLIEGEGLAECIFDIAMTGDQRLIAGSRLINSILGRSVSALAELGVIEDDTTVTAPAVLVGEISTARKIDVYRFDLQQGASVTIDSATTCTNDASFEFVLEAPSGEVVARNSLSRTTRCGRIGLFDLPETGEYILRVYDSFGVTGQYALAVALPGSSASMYVLDDVASGSVNAGGDAFHIFQVAENDTEVYFDSQGCGEGNNWALLNPDLEVVRTEACFQEFTEVLAAGEWTIRYFSDDTRAGSYSFRAWEIPERQNAVYTLDAVASASLSFPTDSELHSFDVAVDGTEVYFDSRGCASGLRWQLIDPDGNAQRFNNCFQGFTAVLDAGTWQIRVYSIDSRFGNYSFRAWEIPQRQNFDYTLEDSQFGELTFPTDSQEYSFDIVADGTEVYFDPQGCASGLRWRLVAPDGTAERYENCFEDFSRTLVAGRWKVRVYSVDDRFGTYRFRIWEIPDRQNFDYEIGDTVNVVLSFPTDSQLYTFDVAADATSLIFDGQGCNPTAQRWQLRRPDGSLVRTRNCFQDMTETLDAGTHTLRVYTDDDRFGTFQFQVREQ